MSVEDERSSLRSVTKEVYGVADEPSLHPPGEPDSACHVRNIVLLQFFVMTISSTVIGPFFPIEAIQMHISQKALGIVFAASPLTLALGSPLAGWACGRAGSFRMLHLSVLFLVLLNTVVAVVPMYLTSPGPLVIALVCTQCLSGAGMALGTNAVITGLTPLFPAKMGIVNGQMETCAGVGYAVGTIVGGVLYGFGGWSLPFLCVAALLLIVGVATLPTIRRAGRAEAAYRAAQADPSTPVEPQRPAGRALLLTPAYLLPTLTVFLVAVSFTAPGPILPVFWASHGLSVEVVGALQATMAMLYATFCLFWGHLSERINPHILIALGLFISGCGYHLIGSHNLVLSGASYTLWGVFGSCIIVPTIPAILQAMQHAGPGAVGLAVGIEEAAYFCGEVVGPVLGVWAQAAFGFPATLKYLATCMLALSTCYMTWIAFTLTPRLRPDPPPPLTCSNPLHPPAGH